MRHRDVASSSDVVVGLSQVLTAVAPRFAAEWRAFAGPLAVTGVPEAVDRWWCRVRLGGPGHPDRPSAPSRGAPASS